MRIGIVNDTAIAVEALRRIIATVPDYEVIWVARDGMQGVTKCAADPPDLILMDMIMPVMDGVEATRQIMQNSPCAIVIVTNSLERNSSKVFEAMGYGALDVVNTPVVGTRGQAEAVQELLNKMAMIGTLIGKPFPKPTSSADGSLAAKKRSGISPPGRTSSPSRLSAASTLPQFLLPHLIVIGASTGGPNALSIILSNLPESFQAAIVIVQHVDLHFAPGLVQWLARQTPLTVLLASEGSRIEVGKVLIAGSNDHLVLRGNLTLTYTKDPQNYPYRPSVDVLFKSVSQHWSRKGTAVLLTGMGRDGAQGLGLLRSKGWHTIAQERESCVVYGMPKAAVELKSAVEVLPLEAIASALIKRVNLIS